MSASFRFTPNHEFWEVIGRGQLPRSHVSGATNYQMVTSLGLQPGRYCLNRLRPFRQYATQITRPPARAVITRSPSAKPRASPSRTVTSNPTAYDTNTFPDVPHQTSGPKQEFSANPIRSPTSAVDYGRWSSLDNSQLEVEAALEVLDSQPRLVDQPENTNDFDLWLRILDYRRQKDGPSGVAAVMEGLMARGSLYRIKGKAEKRFWNTMLDFATRDGDLLENVWAYFEWLDDKHGERWRDFYPTVISFFIRNLQWRNAMRWHIRVDSRFATDSATFIMLLQRFILDARPEVQNTLRALYLAAPHRRLYDEIIPYLYTRGRTELARTWRRLLLCHNDVPHSAVSRQFIRYLAGYFPKDELTDDEKLAGGLIAEPAPLELREGLSLGEVVHPRDLATKALGHAFGIQEKPYSDEYGAKYFATTWVSMDFAINSLFILGATSVGPLTLQAIARREKGADGFRRRIDQLEKGGIAIDDSAYSQALRYCAVTGNQNVVSEIVHTDVHPSVFDDVRLERDVCRSAISTENWAQLHLIANVRLIASTNLAAGVANQLFQVSVETDKKAVSLRVLDTMTYSGIKLFESTITAVSSHMLKAMSPSLIRRSPDASFFACLCSMILHMQFAPSPLALRVVLSHLVRQGRFDEFILLATEVIDYCLKSRDSNQCEMRVHKVDMPRAAREENGKDFQFIPSDIDVNHKFHPIQRIFDGNMKRRIIRRGFSSPRFTDASHQRELYFTDGIRLLAQLRDKGVAVKEELVGQDILYALAESWELLGPLCPANITSLLNDNGRREWVLRAAKESAAQAWGSDILPPVKGMKSGLLKFMKKKLTRSELRELSRRGQKEGEGILLHLPPTAEVWPATLRGRNALPMAEEDGGTTESVCDARLL